MIEKLKTEKKRHKFEIFTHKMFTQTVFLLLLVSAPFFLRREVEHRHKERNVMVTLINEDTATEQWMEICLHYWYVFMKSGKSPHDDSYVVHPTSCAHPQPTFSRSQRKIPPDNKLDVSLLSREYFQWMRWKTKDFPESDFLPSVKSVMRSGALEPAVCVCVWVENVFTSMEICVFHEKTV